MDNLNEKQLLLLSNYAYFDCSKDDGTIEENLCKLKNESGEFDREKLQYQGAISCNISEDEAVDLLSEIDNDEKLKKLERRRSINSGDLRGILYTDDDDNATLVFRGTGGTYNAWHDNVTGEYETDTEIQRLAGDFVRYECDQFKNITVTGHSKGGNLSQYVTVMCPDQIDRCVSYDGQGFGRNFCNTYRDEVKAASGKITSISAYNDFVNILLYSIAGTKLFVNNAGEGVDGHSSYTILSTAVFDENGNFSREADVTRQNPLMKLAKRAGDGIVTAIDLLPEDGSKKASDVLATLVASAMSYDKDSDYKKNKVKASVKAFKTYGGKMLGIIDSDIELPNVNYLYTSISIDKIKNVYSMLNEQSDKLYGIPETLEDVLVRLDYSIMGRSYTETALKKTITRIDKIIKMTDRMCDTLRDIIHKYEAYDSEIVEDVKVC